MTDITPRKYEAALAIVILLCHDAVEADGAFCKVRHAGIPGRNAVALTAIVGVYDVESEKAVAAAVFHDGDRRDRGLADIAHQESRWVGSMKYFEIIQARVPPFGRGPIDGSRKVFDACDADIQSLSNPGSFSVSVTATGA